MENELKSKILSANKAYRAGTAIMSDAEFDSLVEQYEKTVTAEEFNAFRDSLHEAKGKIRHSYVMGSLDKLKCEEPETIVAFVKRHVRSKLNVSAKVDGISCRLKYSGGKLVESATRGDGNYGEDLSEKIGYVKGIAHSIPYDGEVDIRGELVILKSDFEDLSGFANPRNACAGIMNRKKTSKEWNVDDIGHVTFVPYTVLGPEYTKAKQFELLEKWGFENVAWHRSFDMSCFKKDEDLISAMFEYATQDLPYEIDGVVISDDEYRNEDKYRPDAQAAVKTNQLVAETTLIDVVFEGPSKNGVFVPVAVLEPVEIGGSMIARATCHNLDFMDEKGLTYGCGVKIIKSGDIIPKIIEVTSALPNARKIELPTICACCGEELVRDGVNLVCKNRDCSDQKTYQVKSFIKKLGVMNASYKTLKNFGIDSYAKLLSFVPNKSYKSETKFCDELKTKVFTRSPIDLFCSLNMKDLGKTLQKKIVDFYGWDNIKAGTFSGGLPEGIGQITIDKFKDCYLQNMEVVNAIVSDVRYSWKAEDVSVIKAKTAVKGSVCFTGSLNTMGRKEASELAVSAGFEVKSSVTKGLTYLVTNTPDSGSSKNVKAQKLGTKIITEDQFIELVSNQDGSVMDL